jgi:hypothetical protein
MLRGSKSARVNVAQVDQSRYLWAVADQEVAKADQGVSQRAKSLSILRVSLHSARDVKMG